MYSRFTIAKKYLHYWITAYNRKGHAVHSPFVYDFIINVLLDNNKRPYYQQIEQQRKSLLQNKSLISVEDFGAGSGMLKTNKRRINSIAKSSLKSKKYAQLLHRIAQYYKPKTILELGTSFGITTSYLAKSNEKTTKIITLEGDPEIAEIAQKTFSELQLNNIEISVGDFNHSLPKYLVSKPVINMVFIDGNHRRLPTLDYFNQILPHTDSSSIVIFDDIHWSSEMEAAWEEIKHHPSVTLSIDLFFIGLIFFRKDFKVKQHFNIQF